MNRLDFTLEQYDIIINEMISTKTLFSYEKKQIVLDFFSRLTKLNLMDKSYSEIYVFFEKELDSEGNEDLLSKIKSEEDFYNIFFCKILNFIDLPVIKLTKLYMRITDDLNDIDGELIKLKKMRHEIESQIKTNIERYLKYRLHEIDYYIEINETEKQKILEFLTNEIYQHAFSLANRMTSAFMRVTFHQGPYPYSKRGFFGSRNDCKIEKFSVYTNKFLQLPVKEFKKIDKLLKYDNSKIIEIGRDYIAQKDLIKHIKNLINCNFILNRRSDVLNRIIHYYENSDFIALINIIPMQVEGVFHDYCIEIGIDEKNLMNSSLFIKLKYLRSSKHIFSLYNYYAHHFQAIRNDIAHGYVIKGDEQERLAITLFLDIIAVCDMTNNENIPLNASLKLMDEIEDENYDLLIEWVDYIYLEHPDFLDIKIKYENTKNKLYTEKFWEYINCILDGNSLFRTELEQLRKKIIKLKKLKIREDKCIEIIRKVNGLV